jgi:hypothetical protein
MPVHDPASPPGISLTDGAGEVNLQKYIKTPMNAADDGVWFASFR